jgi:hypothetical protein
VRTETIDYQLWNDSQINLTINGAVRFAVEKMDAYVLDDDLRERKLKVVKKTARDPDPLPTPPNQEEE